MPIVTQESVSIIIPTYREAANLAALIQRIATLNWQRTFEVLIVDDNSQDGTDSLIKQLQEHYTWLRLITRHGKRSLSDAVLDGFNHAHYPLCIVMDADLSHPPETIPLMVDTLELAPTDMVIGSRYVSGGSTDENWPFARKLISNSALAMAKALLANGIADPLSGFFAIKKSILSSGATLNPIGWKIGLEIMIKCNCQHPKEIPIHFAKRYQGKSKLNLRVAFTYLKHLQQLWLFKLANARINEERS